jgi:hypothetical protein
MSTELLIHLTGLCALLLNVLALLRTCEKSLRVQSGVAGVVWAFNNLLLGAHAAAALSLLSAGRTASSAATLRSGQRLRLVAFVGFAVLTLAVTAITWHGWPSVLLLLASTLSTYGMFYLRGRRLRWMMLLVSGLWMYNAWSYDSWEQMAANALTALASLYGAWRTTREVDAPARDVDSPARDVDGPLRDKSANRSRVTTPGRNAFRSATQQMQRHFAAMRARAVFPEIDALPRAEREAATGQRNRQLHGGQRRSDMRGHIVRPFIAMPVQRIAIDDQPREESIEIAANIGVGVLLNHQARGRVANEQRQQTFLDS